MTTRVALIRHGAYQQLANTPSAWQPFALTEQGKKEVAEQAQQFVNWLIAFGLTAAPTVYSSPLLRAWQTADIYIEVLKAQLPKSLQHNYRHKEINALSERSVGSVANLSIHDIEAILENDPRYASAPLHWKSDTYYRLPFPGSESLFDAGQRVAQFIRNQCQEDWKGQPEHYVNLVVGHGAAIRHAACHLNVIEICDVTQLSMFHAHPVVIQQEPSKDQTEKWRHIAGEWKLRQKGQEAKD
jgi:2,3-bisphosphoglycerate-dependent phosphoglycerate mutase